MCSDGWDLKYEDGVDSDGVCPDCGMDTYDGIAMYGCNYSQVECNTCGYAPCDGSC